MTPTELEILTAADTLIPLALEEDLREEGDVTSIATLDSDAVFHAQIVAKAPGFLAGIPIAERVYQAIDPTVEVNVLMKDGSQLHVGNSLCEIRGNALSIMKGERIVMNFLLRLSGIATLTSHFVAAVAGTSTVILDTRKTTPGWRILEKYAVRMGGAQNHRIGLYDQVLLKDNHIDAVGGIRTAIQRIHQHPASKNKYIVVEVRDIPELKEALKEKFDRVLLDNLNNEDTATALQLVKGKVKTEASGNMSVERVRSIAELGVDFISVGALTHSAPGLDLSMKVKRA